MLMSSRLMLLLYSFPISFHLISRGLFHPSVLVRPFLLVVVTSPVELFWSSLERISIFLMFLSGTVYSSVYVLNPRTLNSLLKAIYMTFSQDLQHLQNNLILQYLAITLLMFDFLIKYLFISDFRY